MIIALKSSMCYRLKTKVGDFMQPNGQKSGNDINIDTTEFFQDKPQRKHTVMAWLLAAVSLIMTVSIVLGAYYGGRAIFKSKNKDDQPVATTTIKTPVNTISPGTDIVPDQESATITAKVEKTPTATVTPTIAPSSTVVVASPPAPTVTVTPTVNSTATNQQVAGAKTTLANTGPGNIVELFLFVTLLGSALHYKFKSN